MRETQATLLLWGNVNTHRPDLSIRGQLKIISTNTEVQALKVIVLGRGNQEQSTLLIEDATRRFLIYSEGSLNYQAGQFSPKIEIKRVRPDESPIRVVPILTTPAAFAIIVSPVPYCIDKSTPQKLHAGQFLVIGLFQNSGHSAGGSSENKRTRMQWIQCNEMDSFHRT